MKAKHTKGEWRVSIIAEGDNPRRVSYSLQETIDTLRPNETHDANAKLIADAFNVTNETGMTPRELQENHAELLGALLRVNQALNDGLTVEPQDPIHNYMGKVIQKATK